MSRASRLSRKRSSRLVESSGIIGDSRPVAGFRCFCVPGDVSSSLKNDFNLQALLERPDPMRCLKPRLLPRLDILDLNAAGTVQIRVAGKAMIEEV
jgi:hypothetical protein